MWRLLGAPLDSSASGRGEERAPDALREAGIAEALGARDAGDATPHLTQSEREPETGVIAFSQLAAASAELRDAVSLTLEEGDRPLVVGGDCTLLLGAIAGARRHHDEIAMWFVDGHADYLDGATSETGEAADMELAMLTGTAPAGLCDLTPPAPMLDPENVVILGHRPPELAADVAGELERVPEELAQLSAWEISERGAARIAAEWEERLGATGAVWLHLDLDALDEAELGAVTYSQPEGLIWAEFTELTRTFLASPDLIGASIADFNPDLDPEGADARRIVAALSEALG
jgi:arginase